MCPYALFNSKQLREYNRKTMQINEFKTGIVNANMKISKEF